MKIKLIAGTIAFLLFVFLTNQTQAQDEKGFVAGNSFNFMIPQGTMADTYNFGWGVYANFDYNFNKHLAARFDLGWNSVSGPDITDTITGLQESQKMSVWEFTGGLRASVSIVYVEVRGGYFTGVNSWGFVPAVGLRIGRFDIQGNYTMAGDNKWINGRIGFYWAK